jgi:hypothetical protein
MVTQVKIAERYRKVVLEQTLIRENFPFFHSRISGVELTCRGFIIPTDQSPAYRVEIKYIPWCAPDVRIIEPKISFTPSAHMYQSNNLCLYDWREQPWQKNWHLHETVVPWTAEWLIFYELLLLTGKWHGKASDHSYIKTTNPPAATGSKQE